MLVLFHRQDYNEAQFTRLTNVALPDMCLHIGYEVIY